MRRLTTFGLILVGFLIPRAASAQAKMGDREFLVFANLATIHSSGTISGSTTTSGIIFLNVGQFLTDRVEVGGGPNINVTAGGGNTHADIGINVFGRYYFGEQSAKIKPYAGAEYSVTSLNPQGNQSVSDSQFLSGIAGVKDYLSEKAAIDIKASFGFNPSHAGDIQLFNVSAGLTFLF